MKTLQLVLGLMAVLCSGVWATQGPSNCDTCHEYAVCNETTQYYCFCPAGLTGNGTYCEDMNECDLAENLCGPPKYNQCVNTLGSYSCNCSADYGFFFDEGIRSCNRDSNLDLPFLLNATIIAQRDGCYSEDTQPERNAINDTIRKVLQAALLRLGLLPVG